MRIAFMGTPAAAVPTLQRCLADGHEVVAVWTQPDRPSGRGHKITASPVKTLALAHTLPKEFLRAPTHGCINVHFSMLPRYRGAAPVNWAIVKGESTTGVTTMFLVQELDAGPILLQQETAIGLETAPELMSRLAPLGANLLSHTLAQLDRIVRQSQDDREATFAPMLKREDGMINWSSSAVEIERSVRGFQPWPGAYTNFRFERLIVWKAEVVTASTGGEPGEILNAAGDDFLVSCGSGSVLRLLELQAQGKRRMTSRDFLNGSHPIIG